MEYIVFVEDTLRIRISTNCLRVNKLYIFQSILIINDNLYGDFTTLYDFLNIYKQCAY